MLQKMNKVNILSDDKILYWKIKLILIDGYLWLVDCVAVVIS